jgi:hypothetical protein
MLAEGHLTRGRFAAMLRRIALLEVQFEDIDADNRDYP